MVGFGHISRFGFDQIWIWPDLDLARFGLEGREVNHYPRPASINFIMHAT